MSDVTMDKTLVDVPLFPLPEESDPDAERKAMVFEAQVKRIAALQALIEENQTEVESLKQQILDSHPVGTYEAAGLTVAVRAGAKRLDEKKFMAAYPVKDNPSFYKVKVDTASVKKAVAPVDLEVFQSAGKPSVVVK